MLLLIGDGEKKSWCKPRMKRRASRSVGIQPCNIREAGTSDHDAIWDIFRQVVSRGDTYAFDPETPREQALRCWLEIGSRAYVEEDAGRVIGTYILKPNQPGLGSHVANAG